MMKFQLSIFMKIAARVTATGGTGESKKGEHDRVPGDEVGEDNFSLNW
jgi:hypothetical protein